jgi:hypothetical protein
MSSRLFSLPMFVCAVLFLASCAGQPVRNLASDATLIKPGQTSGPELIRLIGEPDERQAGSGNEETWIYREKETSWLRTAPVTSRLFKPRKEQTLTVIVRDNVVFSARYGALAYDQPRWDKDFKWQEGKK